MMTSPVTIKKPYKIGKIKQLIDLNEKLTNFDINFKVTCSSPFDMLVVDQTTLDNNPTLEFKKVSNGEISGNLRQENNVYQNFFLVLKSDNPCECVVEIVRNELPKTIQQLPPNPFPQMPTQQDTKPQTYSMKKIFFILIFIGLVGYGIYWYLNNKKENVVNTEHNPPIPNFRFYSPPKSSSSHNSPVKPVITTNKGSELLERLKRLKLSEKC